MSEEIENKPRRLSYSAVNTLQSCGMKYVLHYKEKRAPDSDAEEDKTALRVGKATHENCEIFLYSWKNFKIELFEEICNKHEICLDDRFKIYACVKSICAIHEKTKLEVVACEAEIGKDTPFIGFIDLICKDSSGFWHIIDLKTSSLVLDQLYARLHKDSQLSLYSAFAHEVADRFKLDLSKFLGCIYRVCQKPRITPKSNESYETYFSRSNVETYDVIIPYDMLPVKESMEKMYRMLKNATELTAETAEKNMQNCIQWNSHCQFWSACFGAEYSKCKTQLEVRNSKNAFDMTQPKDELEGLL